MHAVTVCVGSAVCLVLTLVSTASAQEKQPVQTKERDIHRMEIYNGPYRTVHHFSPGASAAEQAKMREVERSENEAALADQLQALLRQYVADESVLQRRRREVQLLFYGHSDVISGALIAGEVRAAYPSYYGYYAPYYGYYAPYYNYGYCGYGGDPYWPSVTSKNGLFGVGDEGPLKAELAKALAIQVAPVQRK